jgi:hypothetical protein
MDLPGLVLREFPFGLVVLADIPLGIFLVLALTVAALCPLPVFGIVASKDRRYP